MRSVFVIIALGLVASLHIYTTIKAYENPPAEEASGQPVDVGSAILRLADVDSCHPGERITVTGRISGFWEPASKRAPHTVILRDNSGSLEVVHWLKEPLLVSIGDTVECSGSVDLFRGELQLRLWLNGDIHRLDPSEDSPVKITP